MSVCAGLVERKCGLSAAAAAARTRMYLLMMVLM